MANEEQARSWNGDQAAHWLITSSEHSRHAAREIEDLLQDAGYTKTRTETLGLDPPVVCVLAANPDPAGDRSSPASDPTSCGWCSKGDSQIRDRTSVPEPLQ